MKRLILGAAATGVLAGSVAAAGQPRVIHFPGLCGDSAAMVRVLRSQHKEQAQGAGTRMAGASAVSLWVNKKTGTWSVTASKSATTCIVLHGKNWTEFAPPKIIRGDAM